MLLTLAFLGLTGASKEASKETSLFNEKGDYWIKREKFLGNSNCAENSLSTVDYFKLNSMCEDDFSFFDNRRLQEFPENSFIQASCYTDHSGLANGITILLSAYEDDQCLGGVKSTIGQMGVMGFMMSGMPTYCSAGSEYMPLSAPYVGSEKWSCEYVSNDQIPFNVKAENTVVDVGFMNDQCTMDVENVIAASITHLNKCETFNAGEAFDNINFNGIKSRRISDCGFKVEYFTDDNCQVRDSSKTTAIVQDVDFDECNEDGSDGIDLLGGSNANLYMCAGGNYGPYADLKDQKTKKLDGEALANKLDLSFAKEMQNRIANQVSMMRSNDGSTAVVNSEGTNVAYGQTQASQQLTPLHFVVLGSAMSLSGLVGAVLYAKFAKSRAQFEGVEMQSAHSNI